MSADTYTTRTRENCRACGEQTLHGVRIELRTESTHGTNAVFSREPYRITRCRRCGTRDAIRMNDR